MKSNVEKVSSLERKLNIEVPAAEVQAAFSKAFKNVQKHAAIKGFRKGKAPLNTVRSVFGDRVKQDVVQDLIQTHYAMAIEEHKLDPINYPAIEFDVLEDDKDFSFTAEFEIRPEIKLTKFEKLPVKKEKFNIDPKQIAESLEQMRLQRAELAPVLEDRPAQTGDVAVIDFEGHLLTGPLENGAAQDHELELGSNTFIPGFEEGVTGMRIGVTSDVKVSFPETYHVKDIAGKPVTFKVTLKALKKKVLPELNDEFAKKMGPYENIEKLKEAIQQDFEQRETKRINEELKNRLLRTLVEHNPMDVPKSLMTEQRKALEEDFKKRMAQQGMDEAGYEEYKEKWKDDFDKTAKFMVASSFLIDQLSKQHNLVFSQADIESKIQEYAAQTGIDVARMKEFYGEKERRSRLAYQITEEKVVDFILSKADVKEVSREEIQKDDDKH